MKIVPGKYLLVCYAVACVLAAVLLLGSDSDPMLLMGIMALFACIGILDVFISKPLLNGVTVRFPEVVCLSKNRNGVIAVEIINKKEALKTIKIGMLLPGSRFETELIKTIELKAGHSSVKWPLTGIIQGRFVLEDCHVEIQSALGFWALRKKQAARCEIRVYPDLSSEQKMLASKFLNADTGVHSRKMVGKGREFERLREYLPGDLYEDIHWKATARRGIPVTKIFQIERTQDVYVILDASRMSARDAGTVSLGGRPDRTSDRSARESILEKYIKTALSIGLAAEKQGDRFGLLVFDDRVRQFMPAGNRNAHFKACRDILYTLEPRPVTPDFTELISFTGNRIRKRALLIFMTSLDDPAVAEGLVNNAQILSRRHLLMINMINPSQARPVFSGGGAAAKDEIYNRLGGHMVWQFLRELEQSFLRLGIGFFRHEPRDLTWQTISQYLKIKQRQAL